MATHLPNTGWPGARSSGGCGLARPVVPDGASLLAIYVSTRSSVVTNAATIAIATAMAKSKTAVRWLFRSLLMRDLHSNAETLGGLGGSPEPLRSITLRPLSHCVHCTLI